VYAHAPFCVRRCFYCDFAVQVRRDPDPGEWLTALAGELSALHGEGLFVLEGALETLYVGGGTPSLLGPGAMAALAEALRPYATVEEGTEWTAEANPESLTPEIAGAWRCAGVNRLSLGIQSLHEPTLRWMGRLHGAAGAREAVRVARHAGYANLSVDLIFGLPGHLGRDWRADLEAVLSLDVPHVSLYGLSVEEATPLGLAVAGGHERVADEARYADEYLTAAEALAAEGYRHYEVSNFAREGFASRHNAVYWSGLPYLGLGNSSHSYLHPLRRWNLRDWGAYSRVARRGDVPEEGHETLDREAVRMERIWLGLRTDSGLPSDLLDAGARDVAARWRARGWARPDEERLCLTPEGWLVLDRLAVELEAALGA